MRKLFCKNDAADFEDLPAFNEEKVSLTMIVAGVCAAVVAVAAVVGARFTTLLLTLRFFFRFLLDLFESNTPDPEKRISSGLGFCCFLKTMRERAYLSQSSTRLPQKGQ